ncbi:zinc knuckle CX2CX4HX4C containing protein [Tanacetum coccineum]|uniref:Zinc knuckle CX2CX4HX4C containing protein n=1 Tax=Tanacetum coccineum TaxID=301880 RepID=A0ABQ5AYK3_9ASTR
MLKLMDIPGMLHLEGRLLESRGCLLLVCRDDIGSREFTIYKMMKGCSVWTVRYLVNIVCYFQKEFVKVLMSPFQGRLWKRLVPDLLILSYGYFIGKRIAFPVMEYYVRNNWGKYGLTRLMMNSKVWVKIHDVPIQVFSEDGLSIIASQIGKPIMLDSYTSLMCIESWGRSSFARCLIEINADDVLKESLTIGVPLIEDTGFIIKTVSTIEYE